MIAQGREGNWKDVERELPELREWIGKTPSLFLHELKRRNVVTEEEYWKAFTIPDAAKREDSILFPVMRRGEGKRRKLLEILKQQRSRERHFLDMLKTSHLCSPTLNPNSAHRQLQVSADLSTVTWTQEEQPYSDHAERFEQWEIVLCFETFTSGDHYWEVDVRASENCCIGVARGSIPRNCQEKSGRLGWNDSSWAFVQWDFNFKAAHDKQRKTITDVQLLERVGVRLDFNAGKLSFYNANTMELLHSFDDIPSEPLCPAMQMKSGSVTIYEAQSFKNLTVDESREDIQICDHFANGGVNRTHNTDAEKGDSKDALLRTTTEEPPVARELIGRIPAMLHRELLVQGLITQSELSEVYSIPRASARADFIISRLDSKQEESPQLKGILHQHCEKQEAFLKMRRESSTCSPTLNPNTAHRNLQISADFKTVRTSTRTQPYPDNSDSFDLYQPVICSEKFSLGHHYWEMDVRGSEKFNIGVTYGSIPRKAQSFKNLTVDESREDIQICDHFANSRDHRTNNTDAEKGDRKDIWLRTTTEEPPVARELIGRIPAMLHRELLIQALITQSKLSKVYSIPRKSARVDSMISRLDSKQEESPQLREILREHREKQEAFLKMRSESSTCSPTLNPNTAHRNLQISADFKTVRTSTHTQPYPGNSDRFDHYRVVICSEKFSSGRHYWEVDVKGSEKFIIGVTYDAIPRKGDDEACKIGCNEVSWCLKKWGNAYKAVHNGMETKLLVRDAPKRVGVHVDWEAGVLSFYSADSMSLLHRFHEKFDRELYPAMAVLRKSLSICPLPYLDARC
uniref:Uncharacterized protein LOC116956872 isoform X1 n=1 Tax=Petromyzon marinus TaxID=7757 RepID=A0AAJ7UG47_PETMA|nr:uncharacterized protein LOC116956872 isoform X1 [Petromyzon marinus]